MDQKEFARLGGKAVLKKYGRSYFKKLRAESMEQKGRKQNLNNTMIKLSTKQIARIKALHKQGKSQRQIAKEVGCSRSAVWYQLQK